MKKHALILTIILVYSFPPVLAEVAPVSLSIPDTMYSGYLFNTTINFKNLNNITGIGYSVEWDPNLLYLNNVWMNQHVPEGSYMPTSPYINNSIGSMKVGLVNTQPPEYITLEEEQSFFTLEFQSKEKIENQTNILIKNIQLSDQDYNVTLYDDLASSKIMILLSQPDIQVENLTVSYEPVIVGEPVNISIVPVLVL